MKQFMGIHILMRNLNFPRLRMYWEGNYRPPCVANAVTQKIFLSIFVDLASTSDDEAPLGTTNVYWKAQPNVDAVLQTCKALEPEENNSIDEQMSTSVQYVKNEPNSNGGKLFVRSGRSSRMVYNLNFNRVKTLESPQRIRVWWIH